MTALLLAAENCQADTFLYLRKIGAFAQMRDHSGRSVLELSGYDAYRRIKDCKEDQMDDFSCSEMATILRYESGYSPACDEINEALSRSSEGTKAKGLR